MFIGLIPPTGCQSALKMACLTSTLSKHWFACTPSQTILTKSWRAIKKRVKTVDPDGKIGPLATVTLCEIASMCAGVVKPASIQKTLDYSLGGYCARRRR